jgi:hypothetical protein
MYTEKQMENMFEMGRVIQEMWSFNMVDNDIDGKEFYKAALEWAEEFEADPEKDYYEQLYEFVVKRVKEKFGRDY